MMQKVHPNASTTVLSSSAPVANAGQPVTFTATVSSVPGGAGTPSGMVTFFDGPRVIGQVPLNASGVASITRSDLLAGEHGVRAVYASDTRFAASSGSVAQTIQNGTTLQFSQSTIVVGEEAVNLVVTVTRGGNTSASATVDYRTADTDNFNVGCADTVSNLGRAFGRCDFAVSRDTLTFALEKCRRRSPFHSSDDSIAEGTGTPHSC